MARQAGASFHQEDATEVTTNYGQQLCLPSTGPQPGETYLNVHTFSIGTIIEIRQGRHQWIKLRRDGRTTEITARDLAEHYKRCRPGGTLL